jgi:hypothetical protein
MVMPDSGSPGRQKYAYEEADQFQGSNLVVVVNANGCISGAVRILGTGSRVASGTILVGEIVTT